MRAAQPRTVTATQECPCVSQQTDVDSLRNFDGGLAVKHTPFLHPTDEMALRKEDREWIEQQIQTAVNDALNPRGWKKVLRLLREWGGAATIITTNAVLIGALVAVSVLVASEIGQNSKFQGKTTATLTGIEGRLSNLENEMLALRTTQAASIPTSKTNIMQAKRLLSVAQKNSVHLPAAVVEQSGTRFVEAASKEPAAWDAALRFMDYRSFLNRDLAPSTADFVRPSELTMSWSFDLRLFAKGPLVGVFLKSAAVPSEKAALIEPIGQHPNKGRPIGPPSIMLESSAPATLDGYRLRNIIFRGVTIRYNGGPVEIENVYFVNGHFEFKRAPNSIRLSKTVLASAATTFKAVG